MSVQQDWQEILSSSFEPKVYARALADFIAAKQERQQRILYCLSSLVETGGEALTPESVLESVHKLYPAYDPYMMVTDTRVVRFSDLLHAVCEQWEEMLAINSDYDWTDFVANVSLESFDDGDTFTLYDVIQLQGGISRQSDVYCAALNQLAQAADSTAQAVSPADLNAAIEARCGELPVDCFDDLSSFVDTMGDETTDISSKITAITATIYKSIPKGITADDSEARFTIQPSDFSDMNGFKGISQLVEEADTLGSKVSVACSTAWGAVKNFTTNWLLPKAKELVEKVADNIAVSAFAHSITKFQGLTYPLAMEIINAASVLTPKQAAGLNGSGQSKVVDVVPPPFSLMEAPNYACAGPIEMWARAVKKLPKNGVIRFPMKWGDISVWRDKGSDLFEDFHGVTESVTLSGFDYSKTDSWIYNGGTGKNSPNNPVTYDGTTDSITYRFGAYRSYPTKGCGVYYHTSINFSDSASNVAARHRLNRTAASRFVRSNQWDDVPILVSFTARADYCMEANVWLKPTDPNNNHSDQGLIGPRCRLAPNDQEHKYFCLIHHGYYAWFIDKINTTECWPVTGNADAVKPNWKDWSAMPTSAGMLFGRFFGPEGVSPGVGVMVLRVEIERLDLSLQEGWDLNPDYYHWEGQDAVITVKNFSVSFDPFKGYTVKYDDDVLDSDNPGYGELHAVDPNSLATTRVTMPTIHYAIRLSPVALNKPGVTKLVRDPSSSPELYAELPGYSLDSNGRVTIPYSSYESLVPYATGSTSGNCFSADGRLYTGSRANPKLSVAEGSTNALFLLEHSLFCNSEIVNLGKTDDLTIWKGIHTAESLMNIFLGCIIKKEAAISADAATSSVSNKSDGFMSATDAERSAAFEMHALLSTGSAHWAVPDGAIQPEFDSNGFTLNNQVLSALDFDIAGGHVKRLEEKCGIYIPQTIHYAIMCLITEWWKSTTDAIAAASTSEAAIDFQFIPYQEASELPAGAFSIASDSANEIKALVQAAAVIAAIAVGITLGAGAVKAVIKVKNKTKRKMWTRLSEAQQRAAADNYQAAIDLQQEIKNAGRKLTKEEKHLIKGWKKEYMKSMAKSGKYDKKVKLLDTMEKLFGITAPVAGGTAAVATTTIEKMTQVTNLGVFTEVEEDEEIDDEVSVDLGEVNGRLDANAAAIAAVGAKLDNYSVQDSLSDTDTLEAIEASAITLSALGTTLTKAILDNKPAPDGIAGDER